MTRTNDFRNTRSLVPHIVKTKKIIEILQTGNRQHKPPVSLPKSSNHGSPNCLYGYSDHYESYADRDLNVGFSGGEKKKAEILQMLMLEPKLAILDETDSGLDVDAVRTVSQGVKLYRERVHGSLLIITHSTRILEALTVDAAHVMENGVIVKNGGAELVEKINEKGFSAI